MRRKTPSRDIRRTEVRIGASSSGMTYPEFKRRISEFAEATAGVSEGPIYLIITLKGQSRAVQDLLCEECV